MPVVSGECHLGPSAVDLFCGAGGLTRGLVAAGFRVVAAVDNWEPALRTYAANFARHRLIGADIAGASRGSLHRQCVPTDLDLVAGGPPCQGFSIQRIGADEDDRNNLVLAFGRLVLELAPRMFLMENVPGLFGSRGKSTVRRFIREMSVGGYETRSRVLDAVDFGVPQFRRRVFLIGWRRGLLSDFQFPNPPGRGRLRTVREAIGDLPSPPDDFSPMVGDPLHRRMRLSARNMERLRLVRPGGGFEDLPPELRVECHRKGPANIGHRYVYGRLDPERPAGTITARFDSFTRGRFAHPWENRNISLREGARLQGFPDDHIFLGTQEEIAAQIGNAVPPLLANSIATAVCEHLTNYRTLSAPSRQRSFLFLDPSEPLPRLERHVFSAQSRPRL